MSLFEKLSRLAAEAPPEAEAISDAVDGNKAPPKLRIARLLRLALIAVGILIVVWEIIGRSLIAVLFPDAALPPSVLEDALKMLISLSLGL